MPMASANLGNLANLRNLEPPDPRKPRKPLKLAMTATDIVALGRDAQLQGAADGCGCAKQEEAL
jgi:hypothetical protein